MRADIAGGKKHQPKIKYQCICCVRRLMNLWNIDALVEVAGNPVLNRKDADTGQALSFSAVMWEDYDINDKALREKAWGRIVHT